MPSSPTVISHDCRIICFIPAWKSLLVCCLYSIAESLSLCDRAICGSLNAMASRQKKVRRPTSAGDGASTGPCQDHKRARSGPMAKKKKASTFPETLLDPADFFPNGMLHVYRH